MYCPIRGGKTGESHIEVWGLGWALERVAEVVEALPMRRSYRKYERGEIVKSLAQYDKDRSEKFKDFELLEVSDPLNTNCADWCRGHFSTTLQVPKMGGLNEALKGILSEPGVAIYEYRNTTWSHHLLVSLCCRENKSESKYASEEAEDRLSSIYVKLVRT